MRPELGLYRHHVKLRSCSTMSDISTATSASTATFVTALVFNAIVFGAELAAFTILRPWFKAIYEPRTYVPPPSKRVLSLGRSLFLWPIGVFKADYRDIIRTNGLDAYFFVRFLRMMTKILLPIWFFSWVILMPVNSVNTFVGNDDGLDRFTFGNIEPTKQKRYAAHLILVYFFTAWILYNIRREMKSFVLKRQQFLVSPAYAKTTQANTLLVTGIPTKYLSTEALYNTFNDLPGGVKKVWINRNLKELPDIYDRRLAACNKLESAETSLLKTAANLRLAAIKKAKKSGNVADLEAAQSLDVVSVPRDQRPQHRLGWIPFVGEKVDTIEWCRSEIRICTELLAEGRSIIENDGLGVRDRSDDPIDKDSIEGDTDEERRKGQKKREGLKSYPPINSAFITFNNQIAAHLAKQSLTHHEPYRMSGKYIEVAPEDVIWSNLSLNPYERKIRIALSWAATAALIIFWAIPVAFVGIVSNVYGLCARTSWLAWLCKLPKVVVGIIAGILPPVLLAVLMMLLPIVLRLFARFEGIPKRNGVELSLMTRFFIFLVVHSFFVVTVSSGIIKALPGIINNPTSVPSLLAENLPGASTFFLTYIVLQGLSVVAAGFLQIVPLIIYYVKLFILGSTPRSVHGIKFGLGSVDWGTTFPNITLLVVITLGYSIISPIINGLACATFFGFYMVYKYLFLWVYDQPSTSDTGGLFFPKAIQHVFVGLYVQQVCLAALFFLARNQNKDPSAIPEGALMIVLIVLTAGSHAIINNSYGPLLKSLPLSIKDRTWANQPPATEPAPSTDNKNRVSVLEEPAPEKNQGGACSQPLQPKSIDEYGFAHPAVSRPQRTVWLPKDMLGLAEEEERACKDAGVDASYENAHMNEKGNVDISGGPPDEFDEE
ncbi:hypothetical protein E4T56_gene11425 [Termitomyces sp. T112]|nr:hypothetical protein E4T56_gene11425 [Termitomyces sp. T112]